MNKKCAKCGIIKENQEYYLDSRTGKPNGYCKACQKACSLARRSNPAQAILDDTNRTDNKVGRKGNDLTLEFVERAISGGCIYCGETEIRITLDRKDNSLGHTQANVVAACNRCNIIKRDMPFEAWLMVSPGMKKAREAGLFAGWDCSNRATTTSRSNQHKKNLPD